MTNLLLQDPFQVLKEYPEKLTYTLEVPVSGICVKFSPRGDYLAVGCSDGSIIIYDMDCFKPITMLGTHAGAHTKPVQSLSWSYDGKYLWSGGRDWYVKMWDLSQPTKCFQEYRFEGAVWFCQEVRLGACIVTVLEESCAFVLVHDQKNDQLLCHSVSASDENDMDHGYTLVARSHPTIQSLIVTGTSKGWISVFQLEDSVFEKSDIISDNAIRCCFQEKIANANLKEVIISQFGDRIAINSSDRTIRQYRLLIEPTDDTYTVALELEHKYQDIINRLQWNTIFFSNNSGEYLVASTHGSSAHDLYLWETNSGALVRVLEGANEELLDIDWNFYNMRIASNGFESGYVYIWSIVIPPKWSALAPDFEEVEENIDYQEKEDEFDVMNVRNEKQALEEAEEVMIDLCTLEKYDVRGNDLTAPKFVIPIDYEGVLIMQHLSRSNSSDNNT